MQLPPPCRSHALQLSLCPGRFDAFTAATEQSVRPAGNTVSSHCHGNTFGGSHGNQEMEESDQSLIEGIIRQSVHLQYIYFQIKVV